MTHELGTAVASLLLIIVAVVALEPCARRDATHAVKLITNDLERDIPRLLTASIQTTAHRTRGQPGDGGCTDLTVCQIRSSASRPVS
jgi:hypothetical protein